MRMLRKRHFDSNHEICAMKESVPSVISVYHFAGLRHEDYKG